MKWFLKRLGYWLCASFIIAVTVFIYISWYKYDTYTHPEIVKAEPYSYAQEFPVRGWLLWDEGLVVSPSDGTIDYVNPDRAVRVAAGSLLGRVKRGNSVVSGIRTAREGYFIPATDGAEGLWTYPFLWNGFGNISAPKIVWYRNNTHVTKGQVIGKMVYQPQSLKCVAFADLTRELEMELKEGWLKIKLEPLGLPIDIKVRVFRLQGSHNVQVYMDLPFFPLDIITSRRLSFTLYAGEKRGVVVPESCLIIKRGIKGVFRVDGNFCEFTQVEGLPLKDGKFFVSRGLKPGNLLVLYGDKAREGRIKLW